MGFSLFFTWSFWRFSLWRDNHGMKRYLLSLVIVVSGCAARGDEVVRATSPDRGVDAVVLESSGGATTSFGYDVCLAPHGEKCCATDVAVSVYGAIRNDQAYGVNVQWADSQRLIVAYMRAERVAMKRSSAVFGNMAVAVDLKPGVVDSTAPAGAMQYNQRH